MSRALGGHGLAVQLPGEPDRELADVDHLLYLAEGLGHDLPGLDGHQLGQILFVLDQQLTQTGHQRAAYGPGGGAPLRKCLGSFGYCRVDILCRTRGEDEERVTGDGSADGDALVPDRRFGVEFHVRTDPAECVLRPGAQFVGRWQYARGGGRQCRGHRVAPVVRSDCAAIAAYSAYGSWISRPMAPDIHSFE
ncbi:Uncharacterised protein [Mycobacteroides abscessus subsp. abscessus]|nr:Uncharacterised protein [Mycobacteroides abscessus subsp. abscessus]